DLLAILVEEPHRAISREEIARRVLGREWNPDDRGVDVLVSKLRGKLSNLNGPEIIRSLRGVGYQFVAGLQFE
ncbi:MAG: winged helix-turn-helix transcriptional regulator, partial [Pseudomonadales bacterium]|nr:winged helix-turn-helix transcriptional regulator [Pseudomonadales bacterium]